MIDDMAVGGCDLLRRRPNGGAAASSIKMVVAGEAAGC